MKIIIYCLVLISIAAGICVNFRIGEGNDCKICCLCGYSETTNRFLWILLRDIKTKNGLGANLHALYGEQKHVMVDVFDADHSWYPFFLYWISHVPCNPELCKIIDDYLLMARTDKYNSKRTQELCWELDRKFGIHCSIE